MKLRPYREIPKANKIFTDREEPRTSFWNTYNKYKNEMFSKQEVKVLSYYGIGGIGKSTLLNKLQEEMNDKVANPKYVYFDLNITQELRSILEHLKNILITKYNFDFSLYDFGVYSYANKIGENLERPEIKGVIENSKLLSYASDTLEFIPTLSMPIKFIKYADKGFAFFKNILKEHKSEVDEINKQSPSELYNYLPYLFAQDLAKNLKNSNEPLVIFLDTYERLVNEISSTGEPLNNDIWLRGENGLVQNSPNVIWVIAGREKLKWDQFDIEWNNSLDQHLLGNLSIHDADSFLRNAGIKDARLRRDLYTLTNGTPVFLDLCVDRFFELKNNKNKLTIDDFGQNVNILVERFTKYLDDSKKDIIYMLSCLQFWNDEMLAEIGNKILPSFSPTIYEKIRNYSFITKVNDHTYSIHQTIGSILLKNCPLTFKETVEKQAVYYCKEQLSPSNTSEPTYIYYLQLLLKYCLSKRKDSEELFSFYKNNIQDHLQQFALSGHCDATRTLFEPFFILAKTSNNPLLYALALIDYSFFNTYEGKYENAFKQIQEALQLFKKESQSNGMEFVFKNKDFIIAKLHYAELLGIFGKFEEAISISNELLSFMESENINFPDVELEMLNEIGCWYLKLDNYHKALNIFKIALKESKNLYGKKHPITANLINNIGCSLIGNGDYNKALKKFQKSKLLYENIFGEKHPCTILPMVNIVHALSLIGKNEDALQLHEKTISLCYEILEENHPTAILEKKVYAYLLFTMHRYTEALELCDKLLTLNQNTFGKSHRETIHLMLLKAKIFFSIKKYDDALSICKNALRICNKELGGHHLLTIQLMTTLSEIYFSMTMYDESLSILNKLLPSSSKSLIISYPIIIDIVSNLIKVLFKVERVEEAIIQYQKFLPIITDKFGTNGIKTISLMTTYCSILYDSNRFDEALVQCKKALLLSNETLGEKHGLTIMVNYCLANTLCKMEKYKEAISIYQKLLPNTIENFGDKNLTVFNVLVDYAYTLNASKNYKEALHLYNKAYQIAIEVLGKEDSKTLDILSKIELLTSEIKI